jgi:fructokinase
MRKIIGIGETILDIVFRNNRPQAALPGGSVFNGFVSLGRLGLHPVFISELGNDRVGNIIRSFMADNNISTEYVDCFPDGKSPISLAFLYKDGEPSYLFYKDYPNQRLETPFPVIKEDDILVFGSYYSLNPALRERITELLSYARERGAILYYDPNFRTAHAHEIVKLFPTILENFEYADLIRGSDEDFLNIFGCSDSEKTYNERIRFYCPRLIVTRGAEGIELFSDDMHEHFDVSPLSAVSAIGAGDSFNAGVIYGMIKHDVRRADLQTLDRRGWEKIIRYGTELAAEVCMSEDNYISKDFADKYDK